MNEPTPGDAVTTPLGEMWMDDGVLVHKITHFEVITHEQAEQVIHTVKNLTNGKPTVAVVDIRGDGELLMLSIYDDGVGGADLGGTGLAGIAARVRGLQGTFELSSPKGGPTTVTVTLPYSAP